MRTQKLVPILEELELYSRAGLSLSEAFSLSADRLGKNRDLYHRAASYIDAGGRLSSVLSKEFNAPQSVVNLIVCGEDSGTLSDSLKSSREMLESKDDLSKRCLSASLYPMIIGICTVLLTVGLVQGIFPQITPLLTGLRAELPLLTRFVMAVSSWLSTYWLWSAGSLTLFSVVAIAAYSRYLKFRAFSHSCMILIPGFGRIAAKHSLSIFFSSFGSMMEAGMLMHDAYARASAAIPVLPIKKKFELLEQPLTRGEPLHSIVTDDVPGMPVYARPLMRAGESSGALAGASRRIGILLAKDIEHSIKKMTALIEPALMVGMGFVVGSIALSIMLPIYDISKALQR